MRLTSPVCGLDASEYNNSYKRRQTVKSLRIISFGVIAGIIVAATLLILFVTGAIDQNALTSNMGRALAIIGIMIFAFLGVMAVAQLNQPNDSDK